MSKIETGGPAFPCETIHPCGSREQVDGMTLRDYFAVHAMTAIYQDYVNEQRNDDERVSIGVAGEPGITSKMIALESYAMADAMLKAREDEKWVR